MLDLALSIDGSEHRGWQSVEVLTSMERISGSFALGVSEQYPGLAEPVRIHPGAKCTVRAAGEVLITGHVDEVERNVNAQRRSVRVSGRDATGDLVDCTVATGAWREQSLAAIAKAICEPYGIEVLDEAQAEKPFAWFMPEPAESCFDTLERLARMRGVLLNSDGKGRLLLTQPSSEPPVASLVLGKNMLSASLQRSLRERYSDYRVIGQGAGGDDFYANELEGTAKDVTISRHRPYTVLAEQGEDDSAFQERAFWESSVRTARSERLRVHVQGWSHASGLWRPNTSVRVRDAWLGLDGPWLIAEVALRAGERGTRSELTLSKPAAFTRLEESENKEQLW